jgi:hypothetical protein
VGSIPTAATIPSSVLGTVERSGVMEIRRRMVQVVVRVVEEDVICGEIDQAAFEAKHGPLEDASATDVYAALQEDGPLDTEEGDVLSETPVAGTVEVIA